MRRNIVFVVIALLLIGASLVSVRMLVYADANQRLALNSDVMPLLQRAHLLQAADPQQQLHLSIGLQLRNSAELDRLLNAIDDPRSAQYHRYLTPAMFNLLFAPTPGQVRSPPSLPTINSSMLQAPSRKRNKYSTRASTITGWVDTPFTRMRQRPVCLHRSSPW